MIKPGRLSAVITLRKASEDEVDDRTVDLVWSTGFKGKRSDKEGSYTEELSMDPAHVNMTRLQNGAPLLDAHDSWSNASVIGIVERAWLAGNSGLATVRFAKDPKSDEIYQKVKDGILRNVSIGYKVTKYEDVTGPQDTVRAYRATDWEPMEISIVPIGFDPNAQVREEENNNENEVEILSQERAIMPHNTQEPVVLSEAEKAELKAQGAKEESQRQDDIRSAVRSVKLSEAFAETLIKAGHTSDKARALVIEEVSKVTSQEPVINTASRLEVGKDDIDKKREGIENALLNRVDSKNFQIQDNGKQFRGMRILRMMEEIFGRGSDTFLATRSMSTSDLPYILSNVANKSAQAQYKLAPNTWSKWGRSGSLKDYKQANQVKLGDFALLEKKYEGGEYKYGSMGEEKEVAQLEDYGKIMKLTRQMLINDDLGLLGQIISRGGIAGARLEEKLMYDVLLDNPNMNDGSPFFYSRSTNDNLGTAGAIAETAFNEAVVLLRSMKSLDGLDPLDLQPKYLICGPAKETEAKKFLSLINPAQTSNVNIFANSCELIVSNRIPSTKWFLSADPDSVDTVKLFRLEGEEGPRIATRENWSDSSIEFKVEHTVDAAPMDIRGIIYNPGA